MSTDHNLNGKFCKTAVEEEIWLPVVGREGEYEVSNKGRVKSLPRNVVCGYHHGKAYFKPLSERILIPTELPPATIGGRGHLYVGLGRKHVGSSYVHRLVLTAHVGSCPEGMEACHADGNPTNNDVRNLRWDTRANNIRDNIKNGVIMHPPETVRRGERHPMAKTTEATVRKARRLYATGKYTKAGLARRLSMSEGRLSAIVDRYSWKHVH